jgi:2-polyprenyl-3-methyl-5-hydroxy-6-metoxy-1,4-benzoquinol methylase
MTSAALAAPAAAPAIAPTPEALAEVFRSRFGNPDALGPVPKLWHRRGYFPPDVFYEAVVANLVRPGAAWLDVGCGRDVFPGNADLARGLAGRCGTLVGVDPDETIEENPFVHAKARCAIEDYATDRRFDLITLRMVAEHVTRPEAALAALARLTRPGGHVVVFTVNRWAPVALATWLVPFHLHHAVKSVLWRTQERDTFPVAYRMNTQGQIRRLFEGHGFRQRYFSRPADCRVFYRFRPLHRAELATWRVLTAVGVSYPENCLLGVYERI